MKKANPADLEQYIADHFEEALEKEHIRVYTQPVIRSLSGKVCGLEALARWDSPQLGLLEPGRFIHVLEEKRLIHKLDSFVVRKVCEGFHKYRRPTFLPVSVNLSRLDYELCDIFEVVEQEVRANKVNRSFLCIEITESVLAGNEALMRDYIDRFHQAGYQVWMDDFGAGYSSLNVLKDYEFDELKIDMRFLSDLHSKSRRILASIVHMAKEIGIQTLAEGVETREQFEFLRNIGCEKIQGFLFGHPMPFAECEKHLEREGMAWESPLERKFYDDIGQIDVLSATPFTLARDKEPVTTGKKLNSIALALIKLQGNELQFLFTNDAFDRTAKEVGWKQALHWKEQSFDRDEKIPLGKISRHLAGLLEDTRKNGRGTMYSVYNEDYYEVAARRFAYEDSVCGIMLRVANLSGKKELKKQDRLDEGLRFLYAMYDQVLLIDLDSRRVEPLYSDTEGKLPADAVKIETYLEQYAKDWIFPDDRDRFRHFVDPQTMERRISLEGSGSIGIHLRTLARHGTYVWKNYLLVRAHDGICYLLVRDSGDEVRELQTEYIRSTGGTDRKIGYDVLWKNAMGSLSLKFFWKDRERRFLGASRSFLEYYGFASEQEILGKTDEEVGWHVHPDQYKNVEVAVINEGVISREVIGNCIANGESKDIVASKMPVYNEHGKIVGLMGYFSEITERLDDDSAIRRVRTDNLTGLLNTRGLNEDLYAYIDEYTLRRQDFAYIDIEIDEFEKINQAYGYDFGDKVIRCVSTELVHSCHNTATIARIYGCHFAVLLQTDRSEDVHAAEEQIRSIPERIRDVDGVPLSLFISAGGALFSETENKDNQEIQAQLCRMTYDLEHIPAEQLYEKTSRIFHLYEDLPMAYAVYRIVQIDGKPEAIILYVNEDFRSVMGMTNEQLIGGKVTKIFQMSGSVFADYAVRAAWGGEKITARLYYEYLGRTIDITAHQVISRGFCAFTYRTVEQ